MRNQTVETQEIKPSALSGRSFKEYCELFGYNAKTGKDLAGKKILDVGIGNSTFARYVNHHFQGAEVIGIDPRKIERDLSGFATVSEETELQYPQAQLIQGDSRKLPFKDAVFDEVISSNFKQYVLYKDVLIGIIKEMARVCKKGGKIRVTPSLLSGHNQIAKGELLEILGKDKFEIDEIEIPRTEYIDRTVIITKLQE